MHLFYKPDLEVDQSSVGWHFVMDGDEAKHALRVMRLQVGDKVQVTDGKGHTLIAEITETDKRTCTFLVLEVQKEKMRDFHLHIAIAPTKNASRFEWFLEKATEMGIEEITPLLCQRSVRDKMNVQRSTRVVVSALKQSLKSWCPVLNEPVSFSEFIQKTPLAEKYICHFEGEGQASLKDLYQKGKDVVMMIGPEGDFTEEEIKLAKEHGFQTVSLGNTRLRTETAAMVACCSINFVNQ